MEAKSDAQLLHEYAASGSEPAFTEILNRYTNLVFSAALRQVMAPDLAADVAQQVFIGLARQAPALTRKVAANASLAGWLCRSARNHALNLLRDNSRRQSRELQAMEIMSPAPEPAPDWESVRPLLDEAMSHLSESDYDAVVMRFFNNQDLRSVGRALGVSEDTAQKRVSRALDKLRSQLGRRGVLTTSTVLSAALAAHAVQTAPAGLPATISNTIVSLATLPLSTAGTLTKALAMTTLQKTSFTLALAASIGTALYQTQRVTALRGQTVALQQQQTALSNQIAFLQRERDEATNRLALLSTASPQPGNERELLRLRNEVSSLRRNLNQATQSQAEAAASGSDRNSVLGRITLLKQALKQRPQAAIPEVQLLTEGDWLRLVEHGPLARRQLETEEEIRKALSDVRQAGKAKFASRLGAALSSYAAANANQLPTDIAQLKPYLDSQRPPLDPQLMRYGIPGTEPQNYPPIEDSTLQRYKMALAGSIDTLRPGQPAITETTPVDQEYDTLYQVGLKSFTVAGIGNNSSLTGWGGSEAPDLESMTPAQREAYQRTKTTVPPQGAK